MGINLGLATMSLLRGCLAISIRGRGGGRRCTHGIMHATCTRGVMYCDHVARGEGGVIGESGIDILPQAVSQREGTH